MELLNYFCKHRDATVMMSQKYCLWAKYTKLNIELATPGLTSTTLLIFEDFECELYIYL